MDRLIVRYVLLELIPLEEPPYVKIVLKDRRQMQDRRLVMRLLIV